MAKGAHLSPWRTGKGQLGAPDIREGLGCQESGNPSDKSQVMDFRRAMSDM